MSVNTLSAVNLIKLYPLNYDSVPFSTYGTKLIDSKGDLMCQYIPPFPASFDQSHARARICHARARICHACAPSPPCASRDHDSARKRIPTRERVSPGSHSRETCKEPPAEASAEELGRSTATPQVVGGSEPVPCNAKSLKNRGHVDQKTRGSLGVDHGKTRTGLAITFTGVAPRPLPVLRKSRDLESQILRVACDEGADEVIVGLPRLWDNKEGDQAAICRAFAARLAGVAATRGIRVYLMDEYATSKQALNYLIESGVSRKGRADQLDSYAAMVILQRYFDAGGVGAESVEPSKRIRKRILAESWKNDSSKIENMNDEKDDEDKDCWQDIDVG